MSREHVQTGRPDQPFGAIAPAEHPRLLDDLESTQRQMRRMLRWQALVSFGLILIGLAALLALADWMWVLPTPARSVLVGALALAMRRSVPLLASNRSQTRRARRRARILRARSASSDRGRICPSRTGNRPRVSRAGQGPAQGDRRANVRTGLRASHALAGLRRGLTLLGLTLVPLILGWLFWPGLRHGRAAGVAVSRALYDLEG